MKPLMGQAWRDLIRLAEMGSDRAQEVLVQIDALLEKGHSEESAIDQALNDDAVALVAERRKGERR